MAIIAQNGHVFAHQAGMFQMQAAAAPPPPQPQMAGALLLGAFFQAAPQQTAAAGVAYGGFGGQLGAVAPGFPGYQAQAMAGYGGYGAQAMGGYGGLQDLAYLLLMLLGQMQQCGCHHHHGQGQPGGPPAPPPAPPVKHTQGNPEKWYFQHGKYEKKPIDGGFVMEGGNTRIVYNEQAKTGQVYAKVDGQWQLNEVREDWGGKAASPIMLDLDGNGAPDVAGGEWRPHAGQDVGARKVQFDLDGDGRKELTEWNGGKDGLLLKLSDEQLERYRQTGQLEVSGRELYGDQGGKYADGYEKMRALSDADKDGQLAGAELEKHYVWKDANQDGVVDRGEMQSAQEAGVTSVKTTHDGQYRSSFTRNGQEYRTWDWWPTTWQN